MNGWVSRLSSYVERCIVICTSCEWTYGKINPFLITHSDRGIIKFILSKIRFNWDIMQKPQNIVTKSLSLSERKSNSRFLLIRVISICRNYGFHTNIVGNSQDFWICNFVHRLVFSKTQENTAFRKLDLPLSSGVGWETPTLWGSSLDLFLAHPKE